MHLIRFFLALVLALGGASAAQAACVLTPTIAANLGSASSYAIRGGEIAQVSSDPALTCTGALLSLSTANYARASATSASGFTLRSASGEGIRYRLSADPNGIHSFNSGASVDYFNAGVFSLLGISNQSDFVGKVYTSLSEMPSVAAGTYTDTVTMNWSWKVCSGIGLGGLCLGYTQGSGTTTLRITLVVTNDCRISAPPVYFGSAPLASQFQPVTQTVAVDCTKGARFSIAFSEGGNGTARPWRAMSDGAGHKLFYNIYRADGITIWDPTNPLLDPRAGTGSTTPTLLQTYIARIDPAQTAPPPGSYQDTLIMIVSF